MPTTEVVKVYYRAVKPNGDVWIESSSAVETIKMSEGIEGLIFERRVVVQTTSDWALWDQQAEV